MRRWFFNLMCALSLALCVATCVVWARSLDVWHVLGWSRWTGNPQAPHVNVVFVGSYKGRLGIAFESDDWLTPRLVAIFRKTTPPGFFALHLPMGSGTAGIVPLPSGFHHDVRSGTGLRTDVRQFVFPTWTLIVMLSIGPAVWLYRTFRGRLHRRAGMVVCAACGYDLRATPDRCPECGRVVESKP